MDAQGRAKCLTIDELRDRTREIRDVLEPDIARHGPTHLTPDCVLNIASFLERLRAHTANSLDPPKPVVISKQHRSSSHIQVLTLSDIQHSRVHQALRIISGSGTRWPLRLVEMCDELIKSWEMQFGPLADVRLLLYEKGGRLAGMHDERDLSRHALLVKWLSNPITLVSPLQAMESGHLDFKPGCWWIHPIFAFHAGIIDSPDPHGGITADPDGIYGITLTGYDGDTFDSGETITYRVRAGDPNRMKLTRALLHPKPPIRVLRSHTLRSTWSPVAGIRYDGLYKVTKWNLKLDEADRTTQCLVVTLQREPFDSSQLSMREVRKSPRAEDVDDYIEYKRLRELRQARIKDIYRRTPKHDKLLGIIPALEDNELGSIHEDDEVSVTSGSRRSVQLGETTPISPSWNIGSVDHRSSVTMSSPDDYSPATPSPYDGTMVMPSSFKPEGKGFRSNASEPGLISPDAYSPVSEAEPRPPTPEAKSLPSCSQPSAHSMLSRLGPQNLSASTGAAQSVSYEFPIMPCELVQSGSIDWSREKAETLRAKEQHPNKPARLITDHEPPTRLGTTHARIHDMHKQLRILREVSLKRGISKDFYEDMGGILIMADRWREDMLREHGVVQSCLLSLMDMIRSVRDTKDIDWDTRRRDLGLADSEHLAKRYERRRTEEDSGWDHQDCGRQCASWHRFLEPNLLAQEIHQGIMQDAENRRRRNALIQGLCSTDHTTG